MEMATGLAVTYSFKLTGTTGTHVDSTGFRAQAACKIHSLHKHLRDPRAASSWPGIC